MKKKPCQCKIHRALSFFVGNILPFVLFVLGVFAILSCVYAMGKHAGVEEDQAQAQSLIRGYAQSEASFRITHFRQLRELAKQAPEGGLACEFDPEMTCLRVTLQPMCERVTQVFSWSSAGAQSVGTRVMTGPCKQGEK